MGNRGGKAFKEGLGRRRTSLGDREDLGCEGRDFGEEERVRLGLQTFGGNTVSQVMPFKTITKGLVDSILMQGDKYQHPTLTEIIENYDRVGKNTLKDMKWMLRGKEGPA
jgi:hypothetical protein